MGKEKGEPTMSKFAGFDQPKANYSKLPHTLIDELSNITSESELKVILYILRHTWGYHDTEKKITIDEFCNGRKRSDGSRIDGGCGITSNAVKGGIAKAVEHGYIVVEEDARDLARIKRYYSINSGGQKLMVGGQTLTPGVSQVDPRTEKDTIERNLERETPSPTAKSKSLTSEETTKTPPPVPFHPPLAVTAHELTQRRGKSLKYCREYNWQIHRPTFEAIVDAMGKQALVDADNDRTIGDLQQAAVTLTKAGVSAETIIKRTGEWKASWIGQRNGSASQFIEFMGTASAVTASGQAAPALAAFTGSEK